MGHRRHNTAACIVGKVFNTKVTLNKHRRQNHKNDKEVIFCPECGYRSLSAGEHDRHLQRMHKEENDYKCTIEGCHGSYSKLDHYEEHFEIHHNEDREVFHCVAQCNKTFKSEEKRVIHFGKKHPELIVRCRYRCGDEFEFQERLDKHYEKFHDQLSISGRFTLFDLDYSNLISTISTENFTVHKTIKLVIYLP